MDDTIILVTGAARGIGFGIVQALAQRKKDLTILVAARNIQSAENAILQVRQEGLEADFRAVELDVASDESIRTLHSQVEGQYGRLDVLINNAGIAATPSSDLTDFRSTYAAVFDTNITSVGLLTSSLLPLLAKSPDPRVINVSSGRASIQRLTDGSLPPTVSVPYSVSKVALNALTIEMAKAKEVEGVAFYVANPGHCKTDLNGNRGPKPPVEGARVVVELALAERGVFGEGFWEVGRGGLRRVPW